MLPIQVGLAHVPLNIFRGSLIPHLIENNIQTKEEKVKQKKVNILVINILVKYAHFVKIS
jgi:hypothetical protein